MTITEGDSAIAAKVVFRLRNLHLRASYNQPVMSKQPSHQVELPWVGDLTPTLSCEEREVKSLTEDNSYFGGSADIPGRHQEWGYAGLPCLPDLVPMALRRPVSRGLPLSVVAYIEVMPYIQSL